ncbi:adenosylcobinamide-GDP ribazoletransferase [Terasakiella sp. A23]|uniref:adenosylcobinamide-GDP ribazoletransferase n=1 Tax=Terasakiella sp. FCG-A23 TaxID=3080561 RepID=UPI002954C3F5|nr:adenosylcobinamide-GDP ribazoletransferase [Terasakiella sp. A23]MDV7339734.1 adenosylcobinamide-GDP ribazoletransferase [Terasakiella sp. A23]
MSDTSSSFNKNAQNLQSWWEDVQLALVFLTRIPWKLNGDIPDQALNRALRVFPVLGLLVGAIGATVFSLAHLTNLPDLVCALIGVLTCVLVTGALHEDGLADVADGFGGGYEKERKLEIMRDSRVGAYGVLAMIFSIGLRVACLAGFDDWTIAAAAIVAVSALSRVGPVVLLAILSPARTDGLAAKMEKPDLVIVLQGIFLGAAFFIAAATLVEGLLAMLICALALFGFARLAEKQIGGHTGDVCGASQQIVEIVALMVLVATV